jgi:hypothetical protein
MPGPYICPFCEKALRSQRGRERHITDCHKAVTKELLDLTESLKEGLKEVKDELGSIRTGTYLFAILLA